MGIGFEAGIGRPLRARVSGRVPAAGSALGVLAGALLAGFAVGAEGEGGLAGDARADQVLISYARAAGEPASDVSGSSGDNSLYAAVLAEHLGTPGLRLANLLMRVRNTVIELTDGKQRPHYTGSLSEPFYFVPVDDSTVAGERVALVIGNAEYQTLGPLENPVNDARAVAKVLREVGFTVTEEHDLTTNAFHAALEGFKGASTGAATAVLYYSGRGWSASTPTAFAGGVDVALPINYTDFMGGLVLEVTPFSSEVIELGDVIQVMQAGRNLLFWDAILHQPPTRIGK